MSFTEFHFLRPLWLILVPVSMVLTYLVWRYLGRKSDWSGIISADLLAVLSSDSKQSKGKLVYLVLCTVWLLSVVAIAGPTWERRPQPLFEQNQNRVILFDLSLSMKSADLQPSRLQLAKFKLIDLIQTAENKQQALIVFAGDAFIVAPLTNDADTLNNLVPALDVTTVPVQGSRVDKALLLAEQLIENAGVSSTEIVLITDGIGSNSIKVAEKLANSGHTLHVLGVGTPQGAPVKLEDGGLLKDSQGNIVIPGLNRNKLTALANAGKGTYADIGFDNRQIERLNSPQQPLDDLLSNVQSTTLFGDSWIDAGTWLLIPVLLLASLGFRRGWLLLILVAVVPIPEQAHAFEWQQLWKTADQRAAEAMRSGNDQAVPPAASTEWRAAAAFKQKQYQQAREAYTDLHANGDVTATSHYNLGNALAKSEALPEALSHYEQALELDPTMQDAIYNRNIVRQLLEQQEQQGNSESAQSDQKNQDQQPGEQQSEQDNQGEGQQSPENGEMQEAQSQQQENSEQNAEAPEPEPTELENEMQQDELDDTEDNPADEPQQMAEMSPQPSQSDDALSEEEQALEQWLKKIPDDPGGLLKRKFLYQYQLRDQSGTNTEQW